MFESIELSALLISIISGLLLGIPSGPALFLVMDTSLNESKTSALKVYGGFMTAKLIYIALALLANDFISSHQKLESISLLIASFVLMMWGVVITIKSKKTNSNKDNGQYFGSFYRTGFVLGISNPIIPFIYITFLQFIKIYASNAGTFKYLLNIAIMELVIFLVLVGITWILLSGGKMVQHHWNKAIRLMGILLFCAGAYQAYQLVDFNKGEISIKNEENALEQQLEEVEEKTK